jgi:hypothetical protein
MLSFLADRNFNERSVDGLADRWDATSLRAGERPGTSL